jgi:hypothetical protein
MGLPEHGDLGKPTLLLARLRHAQRGGLDRRPDHTLIVRCILDAGQRDCRADRYDGRPLHPRPGAELRLVHNCALAHHFDNRGFLGTGTQDGGEHR